MNAFNSFPSIESFHRVRKDVAAYCDEVGISTMPITYRGKVKLHGTNAGIVVEPLTRANRRVLAQSRSQIISVGNDNAAFALWVHAISNFWLQNFSDNTQPITIFGEWCGRGIQKGTAISNINTKVFAIFAIQIGKSDDENSVMIVEPSDIENFMTITHDKPNGVFVLPWDTDEMTVDILDTNGLEEFMNTCNEHVERVEQNDPWVKSVFGVDGIGEGLVFYPVSKQNGRCMTRNDFTHYVFKAKGDKHKVVKVRNTVQADPEMVATIDAFVEMVVTEGRLEQGVTEAANGQFDITFVGPMIGWMSKDIKKDIDSGEVVLPEGIDWKAVNQRISIIVRMWYINKVNTL